MLFICDTVCPQKYLLRITRVLEPSVNLCSVEFNVSIKVMLSKLIPLPRDGNLEAIRRKERDILVLLWKFNVVTRCSDASNTDFHGIICSESYWTLPTLPYSSEDVFWPFFILNLGNSPTSSFNEYPQASEDVRLQALTISLQRKSKNEYTVLQLL